MEWECHICGKKRQDNCISVFSTDTSRDHGLPLGSMKQNVRYCNDNQKCIKEAPHFRFTKGK